MEEKLLRIFKLADKLNKKNSMRQMIDKSSKYVLEEKRTIYT